MASDSCFDASCRQRTPKRRAGKIRQCPCSACRSTPTSPRLLPVFVSARAVVVTAAPGAGKTTRVPPALAVDGPVIVLQPRRIAARSLAKRVAEEQRWTIGDEVGWHVRFERRFGARTKVLFATEGILTARLQQDPLIEDFRTIVLDEFHERSIHADLGIALAKQAWTARSDLRIVVMSATLDASAVSSYLGGCPIVDVPGALHALDVRYAPDLSLADAVDACAREVTGQVLCFLPGAGEIATSGTRDRAASDVGACSGACRAARFARRASARRGDSEFGAASNHPRDEHCRDLTHRPRRLGGRRHRAAQSVALRPGAGAR